MERGLVGGILGNSNNPDSIAISPFVWDTVYAFVYSILGMVLYSFGMLVRKIHKGSIGISASNNHFLQKYYFPVYLGVPFVLILGEAVMIYSGYQRIAPLKIYPLLLVGCLIKVHSGVLLTGFV